MFTKRRTPGYLFPFYLKTNAESDFTGMYHNQKKQTKTFTEGLPVRLHQSQPLIIKLPAFECGCVSLCKFCLFLCPYVGLLFLITFCALENIFLHFFL